MLPYTINDVLRFDGVLRWEYCWLKVANVIILVAVVVDAAEDDCLKILHSSYARHTNGTFQHIEPLCIIPMISSTTQ